MLRDDQTALLTGAPEMWRYALTGGNDDSKVCFEDGWNRSGAGRMLEDVLQLNNAPQAFDKWKSKKLIGLGAITGPESGGLLVIDFDGTGSQAVRAFHAHFHRNPSELPATLCNQSGKLGRGKVFLRVPPHWWPQLENRSASWKLNNKTVLEAIWLNSTGNGRHAVVCGDHPQTSHQKPLYYRWMRSSSPADVAWADAPDWLLLGIIAKFTETIPNTPEDLKRAGENDPTPWERLSMREKIELAQTALNFCPNREGHGSGTYEKVRRILCGLINECGLDLTLNIVQDSEWESRNDWGVRETLESTLISLSKSTVGEDQRARIGSLFHFARAGGFSWPSWALPPLEQSQLHIDGLKKILNKMNECTEDNAALAAWTGRAVREFGVTPDTLYRLRLEQYLGVVANKGPNTLTGIKRLVRNDNKFTDCIDGLLGRRVHVLAGGSHSGKTTLACFLANRIITQSPIDVGKTRHSVTSSGKVLILTSDCSDEDMVRDLAIEGLNEEKCGDQLRISSGITFNDMIPIVKILAEFKPDLVICDCLTSMAVNGVRIGDPSYADPIRLLVRHNGVSWPKTAFLILHHTSRDEPMRFAGTEQVKAASEELWIYYDPEMINKKGNATPGGSSTRHLLFEKSRGGFAGRKLHVTRDGFQGTWQWMNPAAESGNPLEVLCEKFRAVQDDEWRLASEWQKLLDLHFHERSLRRYLDRLVGSLLLSENRKNPTSGRILTHYKLRPMVANAAVAMISSRGDGENIV